VFVEDEAEDGAVSSVGLGSAGKGNESPGCVWELDDEAMLGV
jgi:hypothetical protein